MKKLGIRARLYEKFKQSTLSNSNFMGDRNKFRNTKDRITEIRIKEVFCQGILKGPENFVRISESSN